jgi:hypothetical protein
MFNFLKSHLNEINSCTKQQQINYQNEAINFLINVSIDSDAE